MTAKVNGYTVHVNGADAQKLIDNEDNVEFLDDDMNVIPKKELQAHIQKDIDAHCGTAYSIKELREQLKAQGIELKED